MDYEKLQIETRFPEWKFEEQERNRGHVDFKENFERDNVNLRPSYNPLATVKLQSHQARYDIYNLYEVLLIDRGFLVSAKLKSILLEFSLCEYVCFDQIKYTINGVHYDDLSFIYFYQDFGQFVDFEKSKFMLVEKGFQRVNRTIRPEDIIKSNLKIESLTEYTQLAEMYSLERKLRVYVDSLCCPSAMSYDVFSLMSGPWDWGIYVSPRLQQIIKSEHITGIRYAKNKYFNFGCKE